MKIEPIHNDPFDRMLTSQTRFAVLTLTVPGLRLRKIQNPSCF
jgi:PIN domain nuclease of toxin-antitoxin system